MKTIKKFLLDTPYQGLSDLAVEFFDDRYLSIQPDELYQGGVSNFFTSSWFDTAAVTVDGQKVALVHLDGDGLDTTQVSYMSDETETGFRQQGVERLMTAAPDALKQAMPQFPYILSPFLTITKEIDGVEHVLIISETGDGGEMHSIITSLAEETVEMIAGEAVKSAEVLDSLPAHISETILIYLRRAVLGSAEYLIEIQPTGELTYKLAVTSLTDAPMTDVINLDFTAVKFSEEMSITGVVRNIQFAELKDEDGTIISLEKSGCDENGQLIITTKLHVPFIKQNVTESPNHKLKVFVSEVTKFDRDTLDAMTGYQANKLCVNAYCKSAAAATDILTGYINRPCSETLWLAEGFPHPVSEDGKLRLVMESSRGGLNTLETQAVLLVEIDV